MILKRDGWIAHLYFMSLRISSKHWIIRDEQEYGSDLCRVGQRLLIWLPIQLGIACIVLALFLGLLFVWINTIWKHWFDILIFFPPWSLLIPLGLAELIVIYIFFQKNEEASEVLEAVVEWVAAKKSKYCPRVEFK